MRLRNGAQPISYAGDSDSSQGEEEVRKLQTLVALTRKRVENHIRLRLEAGEKIASLQFTDFCDPVNSDPTITQISYIEWLKLQTKFNKQASQVVVNNVSCHESIDEALTEVRLRDVKFRKEKAVPRPIPGANMYLFKYAYQSSETPNFSLNLVG